MVNRTTQFILTIAASLFLLTFVVVAASLVEGGLLATESTQVFVLILGGGMVFLVFFGLAFALAMRRHIHG